MSGMDTPDPPPPPPLPPARRTNAILTLVVVLATVFGAVWLIRSLRGPVDPVVLELEESAEQVNALTPIPVGDDRILTRCVAGPGRSETYYYTFFTFTKPADFDQEEFIQSHRPHMINNYRTNPDLRSTRLDGVTLRYNYSDKNGVFLAEIEIKPTD